MENVDHDLKEFLYDASEPAMVESNELERYIAEPLLKIVGEFDILAWWKNKRVSYPFTNCSGCNGHTSINKSLLLVLLVVFLIPIVVVLILRWYRH